MWFRFDECGFFLTTGLITLTGSNNFYELQFALVTDSLGTKNFIVLDSTRISPVVSFSVPKATMLKH